MKIHTGDSVLVISGKDKGKTGTVLKVLGGRLVVGDINMRTKHIRKTAQQAGQRIRYEASIAVSNVMLLDPKEKKPTRVGVRLDEKGHKVRFAKRSGQTLAAKAVTKGKKPSAAEKAKEGVEKAEPKKAKETKKEAVEKVAQPPKKPFWKRLSFGAEALEQQAGVAEAPHKSEDHSVPEQTRVPESFSHQRGS